MFEKQGDEKAAFCIPKNITGRVKIIRELMEVPIKTFIGHSTITLNFKM